MLYFNSLSSVLQSLDEYDFFGGGDLNARIAYKLDYSLEIDSVPLRNILDHVVNKHGESFLEFLMDNKMCVLNGRSKGQNDFTCIGPQGLSVVDYCFVSHDYLKYVINIAYTSFLDILNTEMQELLPKVKHK